MKPLLSAVVVHWGEGAPLGRLVASWPADPRFELVVVCNQAPGIDLPPGAVRVEPGRNLGFGGGANLGAARASADLLLFLNSDARPLGDALEVLLAAALPSAADPNAADPSAAAGLVPALVGPDGSSQHRWQLQPLPAPRTLLLQVFFLAGLRGPETPPPAGAAVEQPAAAALLLRRRVFEELGGFDAGFFPAWFEDVDLARRLADGDHPLHYVPAARFEHEMGSSVPALGYGPFLWIYLRHLERYLRKHHGAPWALAARCLVPFACLLRILALPLRRPRRARSRLAAARGLLGVAAGALTAWRRPRPWARRFDPGTAP